MPITRVRDGQGRSRFEFEFSRRIGKRRIRTRKLLPPTWSRSQADAFDRKQCALLYAQAQGIEARRWTIDDAVARYLDERAIELKNGRNLAAELARIADAWRGRAIDELPEVCAAYLKDNRARLAPATIQNRLRYLAAACRWGWKHHSMSTSDPAARVVMPAVSNERQVYVDRRQMLELASACEHRPTRAAIRMAWYSGMRWGEIARARRIGDAFLLDDTKNGEPRIVPMHPKVRCCAGVELASYSKTMYEFGKARAVVGLRHVRFHDLRHSTASALIASGVDLHTIGAILGHKSRQSTARYTHLATAALRVALERLGRRAA